MAIARIASSRSLHNLQNPVSQKQVSFLGTPSILGTPSFPRNSRGFSRSQHSKKSHSIPGIRDSTQPRARGLHCLRSPSCARPIRSKYRAISSQSQASKGRGLRLLPITGVGSRSSVSSQDPAANSVQGPSHHSLRKPREACACVGYHLLYKPCCISK